jgi:hypothetical protein
VVAAVVSALVVAGALVTAAVLRAERAGAREDAATSTVRVPPSTEVGADGCLVAPCVVVDTTTIGSATVELVADAGGRSGRVRIGGSGAGGGDVIEVTVTELGATLATGSLQCVPDLLAACVVRGPSPEGVTGQVIVGRSGKWGGLAKPFVSDAGYLAIADVVPDVGPEVIAAQHRCDRAVTADCADTKVFVQVYSLRGDLLGCTRDYNRIESLPGHPAVDLSQTRLRACA